MAVLAKSRRGEGGAGARSAALPRRGPGKAPDTKKTSSLNGHARRSRCVCSMSARRRCASVLARVDPCAIAAPLRCLMAQCPATPGDRQATVPRRHRRRLRLRWVGQTAAGVLYVLQGLLQGVGDGLLQGHGAARGPGGGVAGPRPDGPRPLQEHGHLDAQLRDVDGADGALGGAQAATRATPARGVARGDGPAGRPCRSARKSAPPPRAGGGPPVTAPGAGAPHRGGPRRGRGWPAPSARARGS